MKCRSRTIGLFPACLLAATPAIAPATAQQVTGALVPSVIDRE